MVICVKCGKEQINRRSSRCEYDGYELAGINHVWRVREEFIDELREKLPPFIDERIATWQKKLAEKEAEPDSLKSYNRRLDKIQAEYDEHLNKELPLNTGSQNFADELAREWRYNHGIDKKEDDLKSAIEVEKDNWNYVRENLNRAIHNAERALVGSDEELLNFYQKYKPARDWYLENIYEDE